MAFPIVEAYATTGRTAAETTSPVTYPAIVSAGALLICIARCAVAGAIGWPAEFTELVEDSSDASDDVTAIAYKVAVGDEDGTTFNVTHGNGKSAYIVYSITGAEAPAVQPPELSTVAVGTSTTPDPSSLTPTSGAKDYLWLWLGGWEGEQTSPPAGNPTNYTNPLGADTGTAAAATTNCRVASAQRNLNAASENPPSWTISVSDDWSAWTMAVHPAPTTRRGQVSWAELEVPLAPRRAQVSWSELEAPSGPRRGQVSWSELEVPTAPRRGEISWAELEAPIPPRRAYVSWSELETPNAPRRGLVSWGEFEVPLVPRRGQVSWAELEVPIPPRRALVSWGELQLPTAPRRAFVSWGEFEAPTAPRMAYISWAEMELPLAPRRCFISWAELEIPNLSRRVLLAWTEIEVPDANRRVYISWTEFEVPDAGSYWGIHRSVMSLGARRLGVKMLRKT